MPDTLVMTATPIPRTAAMTVFGDLDLTVLDELPPGRTPIDTRWADEEVPLDDPQQPTWRAVRDHVRLGQQAYVVCPLVEQSETKTAAAATDTWRELQNGALTGLTVGLVHGKQKHDERADVMAAFQAGELDVLVATTVIEVGVDVPNATVMVILDPGSFGMAQLHQMRGRVGRGEQPSTCLLVGKARGSDARRRMEALCRTTDGFALADIDLDIRGEGAVFGARQHGTSDLRVASLKTDRQLLSAAREDAAALTAADPTLARRPGLRAEVRTALGPDGEDWLDRS